MVVVEKGRKIIAQNKKAWHDYYIEDTYEAGIELAGTEVKSLREGKANLKDSFASIVGGEMFIKNMHISPYEQGNIFNKDPLRIRRLLLHKSEISKLFVAISQQGYTLVPTCIYFRKSLVKVELALAKGKQLHDKRSSDAERTSKRDIDRAIKDRNR